MRSIRSFKDILGRFLDGLTTTRENEIVEKWYAGLDSENNYPQLDAKDAGEMHQKDFEIIRERIRNRGRNRRLVFWPSLAAAAVVTFVIFGVLDFNEKLGARRDNTAASKHALASAVVLANDFYQNNSSREQEVWLIDSSRIVLRPNASIKVAASFNQKERPVELSGEAFFDIRRDESKPFKVFTYGVITRVLGTSFMITAPSENAPVKVVVKSGRVSVKAEAMTQGSGDRNNEVVLTANQQVTFDPGKESLAPSLVEVPVLLPDAPKPRRVYDAEPVAAILLEMEKLYGVDIVFDEGILKNCKITTAFQTEDLYQRLQIIGRAIGADYEKEGLRILFKSNGCRLN